MHQKFNQHSFEQFALEPHAYKITISYLTFSTQPNALTQTPLMHKRIFSHLIHLIFTLKLAIIKSIIKPTGGKHDNR